MGDEVLEEDEFEPIFTAHVSQNFPAKKLVFSDPMDGETETG